ncbi:MAG: RlpA-like double-psi beta-barrel domain-containing protein, partial [Pseudomonadota bacterium]
PNALTSAHTTLPFGSRILVTNEANDLSVELRVNDRGPFPDGRVLNVTSAAATALGLSGDGLENVRIKYLGQRVTAIGGDTLETRQLETRTQSLTLRADDEILSMNYAPDGTLIATGSASGQIRIWDAATGTLRAESSIETNGVLDVKFSPNGRRLLIADDRGVLRVWDSLSLEPIADPVSNNASINAVSYSNRGNWIAIGTDRSDVSVLEADTLIERIALEGHTSSVQTIDFSSDDQLLVAAGDDGSIRTWDIATGEMRLLNEGDGVLPTQAVYSPDDRYILVVAIDGTIKTLDARTGDVVSTLDDISMFNEAAETYVFARFSPDAERLLTIRPGDEEVQLWGFAILDSSASTPRNIRSGGRIIADAALTPRGTLPGARAVFSPTENRVLTANGANTATIWTELSDGTWLPARNELPCRSEDGQAFFESFAPNEFEKLWVWSKSSGLCQIAVSGDLLTFTYPLPDDTTMVKMIPAPGGTALSSFLIGRANGTVEHRGKVADAPRAIYHGHGGPITQIEIARSSAGLRAAIAAGDGSVQIVDLPARDASYSRDLT